MKIILSAILLFILTNTIGQNNFSYSYINQSENKLLDLYNIDYVGPFTRYKVLSKEYINFKDTILQKKYLEEFDKFKKWNNGYFNVIPDTNNQISDGIKYMKNKKSNDLIKLTFNETRKIIGFYSIDVNDFLNDVKTIEILELNNLGMKNYIDHVIMIKRYNDTWELFTYDDDDITLDCAQCITP